MGKVTYVAVDGTRHTIELADGENVMRGALYNEIDGIIGECGGGLACATCHCYVDETWADRLGQPATREESELLEAASAPRRPTSRLSCQIVMAPEFDGLVVHLPETQY
ncbi:2Fe-2S iron-sulfur cluster-binding protein [Novosphingobium aerophilum]|uniref:2Fe-2S iron-sulfur cluster binding domain-containing protein n=1 Tax=Novosphingobium aerophilum TaxID=2839843 RepID=A0A7X1KAT6_9SPHN|nr:2Fe-2S iron-sulfur cluster-binding protein [Novosphingobium aerophilum]MBC2650362.1 2Fe-2S iron-sulfur cluster binding domain-containing protein [Novosphingobium aerophilum]